MIRVRVRGIYATALAKTLLDHGFELSDLSAKLRERLGYEGSPEGPHVTVKQSDRDPDELVIIGFPREADSVIDVLRSAYPFSVHHVARPNLHSAYKVVLDENCETVVDGLKAKVRSRECYEGKETIAEVVKSKVREGDEVEMEEGFRVIGIYAELIVGRGPGVTFSRHITNPTLKGMLMSLAADLSAKGFKVHWRSAARSAPLEVLREELEKLVDEASKIMVVAREAEPGTMLYPGERLDVVDIVLEDKVLMDAKRREVIATMPFHHSLKSGGEKMSAAAELGDKVSSFTQVPPRSVEDYLRDVAMDSKGVLIVHKKVNGEKYVLGKARPKLKFEDYVVLMRNVKEYGKYDGLGVIKEPGDIILTFVKPFSRNLIHSYFNEYGELKGIYVNINTGLEIGEGTVRYLDLEVDVVIKDDEVSVIDMDELDHLPAPLRELATKEVEEVLSSAERIRELVERVAPTILNI